MFNTLSYKFKNWKSVLRAYLTFGGQAVGNLCGATAFVGLLTGKKIRFLDYLPGYGLKFNSTTDLGVLSARMITKAGVTYLVDEWVNATNPISNMKYHDAGTGTTAEANTQTALVTPWGGARVTGTPTKTGADNNVLQSVATISFNNTFAITEHGLFSASTTGTMWDRHVFSAINVTSGDSIEFTYQCSCQYES